MPRITSRMLIALALVAVLLVAYGLVRAVGPAHAGTQTSGIDQSHCGDVNGDGIANPLDVALVLQYTAGLIHTFTVPQNADADGNGRVDARDAGLILQVAAHRLHIRDLHCP